MSLPDADAPFPCPFCHASRVVLIGGGLVFLHYQCAECSEVWTAMAQSSTSPPARTAPADPVPTDFFFSAPTTKVWRH